MGNYLWQDSVTVLIAAAYNNGLLRAMNYIQAHAENTTVTDIVATQHTTTHIVAPATVAASIGTASSDVVQNVETRLREIMTRINAIEGSSATTWGGGTRPATLVSLYNAVVTPTIIASPTTPINVSSLTDLRVTATGTSMVLTGAGGTVMTSGGATIDAPAGQTVTPAATTAAQYFPLYYNDSGTLVLGTPAGTRAAAVAPAGVNLLGQLLVPANCTAIYQNAAAAATAGGGTRGYLLNPPRTVPYAVGGGGGGSGAPVNSKYWISGTDVGVPQGLNAQNPGTNDFIHPNVVRNSLTDASLHDLLQTAFTYDLLSPNRLSFSGNTVSISASVSNPATISIQGARRKVTGAISAGATGAAGIRFVVADCSVAGISTWSLLNPMPTTPTVAANQLVLAVVWFDGSALQAQTAVDFTNVAGMPSSNVTLQSVSCIGGGVPAAMAAATSYAAIPGVGNTIFYLPKAQQVEVSATAAWLMPVTGTGSQIVAVVDGALLPGLYPMFVSVATGAGGIGSTASVGISSNKLAPGMHTLSMYVLTGSGNTLTVYPANCAAWLKFYA
jgi:hypothetical protein